MGIKLFYFETMLRSSTESSKFSRNSNPSTIYCT